MVFLFCGLCLCVTGFSQHSEQNATNDLEQRTQKLEKALQALQKLKVSGYIQAQYQWGEQDASLKVGAPNENPDKAFQRIGIRRGRIKFTYGERVASGVFQLDITEKGVGIKDAYLNLQDPWIGFAGLKAGVFDRPFGNEISYSSSKRESPERSTIFQTLFPEERDLGVMLYLQAPKSSSWHFLKLEAGLFAGNGIKQDTDNKKDFIGHLSADGKIGKHVELGGGVSYYYGNVYQGTENVYKMDGVAFVLNDNPDNKGKFAKREYIGFDVQFGLKSILGATQLRGEYLFGRQPGGASNSKSPNSSSLPATDTYIRDFLGGYVIFVQGIGKLPLSIVLKYDWYNPNTKVAKNETGLNNTGASDVTRNTFGFGALWQINKDIYLQAFYEINKNEISQNLDGYTSDRRDDLFTLRLQYKF